MMELGMVHCSLSLLDFLNKKDGFQTGTSSFIFENVVSAVWASVMNQTVKNLGSQELPIPLYHFTLMLLRNIV